MSGHRAVIERRFSLMTSHFAAAADLQQLVHTGRNRGESWTISRFNAAAFGRFASKCHANVAA